MCDRKQSWKNQDYCVDNGLRQSVLLPGRDDEGALFENAVFLQLLRNLPERKRICYFQGGKECDFIIHTETGVKELVQVCMEMKDRSTREREIGGILEASSLTGCRNMTIVTLGDEEDVTDEHGTIHIVPAWKWFLNR